MRTNSYAATYGTLLVSAVLLGVNCSDGPSGPEDDPPVIEILFPTAGSYDRDQDGLVDIEIAFRDTGSGLNEQSLEIRSNRPLGPSGTGGANILDSFEIVARDSLHIVLEETTNSLLPTGEIDLVVRIADRLGNLMEGTIQLDLPAGAFHKHMPSPTADDFGQGIELVPTGPNGAPVGLLLLRAELVPFDPRELTYGEPVSTQGVVDPVDGEWDTQTQRLYLVSVTSGDVVVLDPVTMQIEQSIPIFARSTGISQGPSGLLYISCSTPRATISVVDPVAHREIRFLETTVTDPVFPNEPAFIATPRVAREEDRAYVPLQISPGGILVVDLVTAQVIRNIDVNPLSPLGGIVVESDMNQDRTILYLGESLQPGGLTVLDVESESIVTRVLAPGFRGAYPTLSPTEDRIFLTLGSGTGGVPENWIIDTATFEILARIPVPHANFSGAHQSVFRPDGQLVFVVTGNGMSVYLNRE